MGNTTTCSRAISLSGCDKTMRRSHPLGSEASMAELDRLWGDEDLTILGVRQAWSAFHGFHIGQKMLKDFTHQHRARYPDRRRLNGGLPGSPRRTARDPVDLWGASALVKQGRSIADAAAIARVPVAALRRFIN